MLLNPGSFVTISHYSLTSVFRSTVLAANGNNVEVKLPKECMRSNFLVGDPLAVAYEVRNLAKIKGAKLAIIMRRRLSLFSSRTPMRKK